MVKQLITELPQKIVFGLKMGIEGAAPYICPVRTLLHTDVVIVLLCQQTAQSAQNGASGFFLPPAVFYGTRIYRRDERICIWNGKRKYF